MSSAEIVAALSRHRFRFANEAGLQRGIEQILSATGIAFQREAIVGRGERLDFLVEPDVAIEVKIDGSLADLTRQIFRYTQCERVGSVVVATSRLAHTRLPEEINGKPVAVAYLGGGLSA